MIDKSTDETQKEHLGRQFKKLFLVLIVLGGIFVFEGYKEYNLSKKSSEVPKEVELATLENGEHLDNYHVKIGPHWRIYSGSVFTYEPTSIVDSEQKPENKVTHVYYPIISNEHPFFPQMGKLAEKHGSFDAIPDEEIPDIEFTVLVITNEFNTIGDIPEDWIDSPSIQGLVINEVSGGPDDEERELIKSSFPNIDFDKVLILDEGRTPTSSDNAKLMMGGGVALSLAGLGLLIWSIKRKKNSDDVGSA